MQIFCKKIEKVLKGENQAFVVGLREESKNLDSLKDFLDSSLRQRVEKFLFRKSFSFKKNDVMSFDLEKGNVLYVAILSKEPSLENIRQTVGRMMDSTSQNFENVEFFADSFSVKAVSAEHLAETISETLDLALYRYDRFKPASSKKRALKTCSLSFQDLNSSRIEKSIEIGQVVAESVNFTRDLVNSPANELPPRVLADRVSKMAKECGISFKAFDKKALQKMKMGGILAVSQGSAEEPRFIVMEYGNAKSPVDFVFVGKGVTFDSGGISIKPSDGMEKMKYDMAGGAAVAGILRTVAKLGLKTHIVGIIPAAENMPSGTAVRPGDVIWMGSGKSVEVLNTDAEGRLLLGDGLFYAQRYKPKMVIDLATLTGACVVALGQLAIGLMGNDEKVIHLIKEAGENSGERAWELPLWDDYFDQIKGDVGEIKNVGSRGAGTITAAMFLKQFVNFPWAHLDIAGTAWADEKRPYCVKGSTGIGVRLLTRMIRDLKK